MKRKREEKIKKERSKIWEREMREKKIDREREGKKRKLNGEAGKT